MDRHRQTSYRNIRSKKKSKKQEPTSPCRANERELESLDLGLDVPKLENDGSVFQFVYNEDLYACIIKLMKLRYWRDLGEKDAYYVAWNDGKNNEGVALEHLVRVYGVNHSEQKKIFTITMYNTVCKVMIQGTHRQFWASNEFPLLFRIADEVLTKGRSYSDAYMICTGSKVDIDGIDLIHSDHEADSDDDESNNLDVAGCVTPGYNVQSVECFDEANSSDESLLEFKIKNTNKTPLRKRSKTGRAASSPRSSNKKRVLKKAGRSRKPVKFAPQSKDNLIITQRLNNLKEALCKVESNYANEAAKV